MRTILIRVMGVVIPGALLIIAIRLFELELRRFFSSGRCDIWTRNRVLHLIETQLCLPLNPRDEAE